VQRDGLRWAQVPSTDDDTPGFAVGGTLLTRQAWVGDDVQERINPRKMHSKACKGRGITETAGYAVLGGAGGMDIGANQTMDIGLGVLLGGVCSELTFSASSA